MVTRKRTAESAVDASKLAKKKKPSDGAVATRRSQRSTRKSETTQLDQSPPEPSTRIITSKAGTSVPPRSKGTKKVAPAAKSAPQKSSSAERPPGEIRYFLMKAEPNSRVENGIDVRFSIDDLASKKEPEAWDGIRNHVAKNNLLSTRVGDLAFFYHSNCKTPAIVGTMEIVAECQPDVTAWDPKSPYYDPRSSADNPKWFCPRVEFRRKFEAEITLEQLKSEGQPGRPLAQMQLLKLSRLSVSNVSRAEWDYIMTLVEKNAANA